MVLSSYAAVTPPTMFAAEWFADHTYRTEMGFVESNVVDQVIDSPLRLATRGGFGYKARISRHRQGVEICTEAEADRERQIEEEVCVISPRQDV